MPNYLPFGSQAAAKIALSRMIDRKCGPDCGIIWQEGSGAAVLRPPIRTRNGVCRLLVAEYQGVVPAHKDPRPSHQASRPATRPPSEGRTLWDGAVTAADGVGTVLAVGALDVALAAVVAEEAAAAAAIALVVVTAVEAVVALLSFAADGTMWLAEMHDRIAGGNLRKTVSNNWAYNAISTWGPVLSLISIGNDISNIAKLSGKIAEVKDLLTGVSDRLIELAPRWVMEGDEAILQRMKELRAIEIDAEAGLRDGMAELRRLWRLATPADLVALANDKLHVGEIYDGLESEFRSFCHGAAATYDKDMNYVSHLLPFGRSAPGKSNPPRREMHHLRLNMLTATPARRTTP